MYVRTTSVGREVIYNHLERKKKEKQQQHKTKMVSLLLFFIQYSGFED